MFGLVSRRLVTVSAALGVMGMAVSRAGGASKSILDFGAVADGASLNTKAIQAAIDAAAASGGGTVVVPRGVFVSGALFFKPKVHLHLEEGAVLRCSTDMVNFPVRRTRIEGHFEEAFNPALINADGCDGFHISGKGVLDGAGRPIWDQFWKLRNAAPDPKNFRNLGVPRARLALIEKSKGVVVEGITFKDSQFWNLHLYRCTDVTVRGVRFEVPDDYKQAPSTDGIDLDSCQNILIENCFFTVTDDCIAAKGTKGPHAMDDKDSPPVEHVHIRGCTFRRGYGVLTCGSEATLVRDVVVEDCTLTGAVNLVVLKLRPDTPQRYEDITYRNITLESESGAILLVKPWTQYFDLKGETPPQSFIRNLTLEGLRGRFGAFGTIAPNPGQTTISNVLLKDFDVTLKEPAPHVSGVEGLRYENVVVNGKRVTL